MLKGLRNSMVHLEAPALGLALDDYAPVPVGETGLVSWGVLRKGESGNPETHFKQLVSALGLAHEHTMRDKGVEPQFLSFAEGLAASINQPGVLHTRHRLYGLTDYESPLSWKNGRWHHTFPVAISAGKSGKVGSRVQKTLGRIDACVPRDELGVIVAVHDENDPALNESLARAEEYIRKTLEGRVETMRVPVSCGKPNFNALAERVEHDVHNALVRA